MVIRRRLIYWLLKEYIKKWGKTFLLFFFLGLLGFCAIYLLFLFYKPTLPQIKKESIGLVGAYTPTTLPPVIMNDVGRGLTKISPSGAIQPDLAKGWTITNKGKTYTFTLKPNEYFTNGKKMTSDLLTYNFSDAKLQRPDKYTLVFHLKDTYTPFLTTVSRPILLNGRIGVGKFKIKKITLNGEFVQSIILESTKNPYDTKSYQFYPTADSVKTAFLLGEITQAQGLYDDSFRSVPFANFPNVTVKKDINTSQLVTLFYNTKDAHLSNRDVRIGLTYALPNTFPYGKRTYTFYPDLSWAYASQYVYPQDLQQAKKLTEEIQSQTASNSASLILSIKTLPKYKETAEQIAKEWQKIGIQSIIETVDTVPSDFQIFLGDYTIPKDPDQYMLWHSKQANNITGYENKRIDKLLEDGRKTISQTERKKIYDDLQKYLLADAPAAFLYFPYEYTVTRK